MARHFGPQHIRNGYAAMGGSLKRPIYGGFNRQGRSVAESIQAERAKAAREARAKTKKAK